MIRNFKLEIERNIKSIFLSGCMIMLLVLFAYSDSISIIHQYGKFKWGEWTNILLNDTYTAIYGFSFVFLYLLIIWNRKKENEMYFLIRYKNRDDYYTQKYYKNILLIIIVMLWILVCGCMTEFFCSSIQNEMSTAFQKYCEVYGYSIRDYKLIESIVLYFLLFFTNMNVYFLYSDRIHSIPGVLCICGGGVFLLGGATLGAFGEQLRCMSIFTWGRGFEVMNIGFFIRIGIFVILNSILIFINFIGFRRRELRYEKGNKQYQTE
ncbi:MAG: hypothetical protein IAC13_08595 [Firmicutes bacterium]|uniref:Uncharacterized protein n=1 Tax=Candidatus Scybalomonas excrementavium TaxID=2840943 RepID=A0A9D9I2C3_9FIRM|nr:hypothetical protein [Candidatus Scybalomonas excrementavium]